MNRKKVDQISAWKTQTRNCWSAVVRERDELAQKVGNTETVCSKRRQDSETQV